MSVTSEKNKIALVEYQGRHDKNGDAVGHAPKVFAEYLAYVDDDFIAECFIPGVILKTAIKQGRNEAMLKKASDEKRLHRLPYSINMEKNKSFTDRIKNKLYMFANIRAALKNAGADKLWFFNTEYYFWLYLFIAGTHGKEIYATTFMEGFKAGKNGRFSGIKQRIFEAATKKAKLIISTGPSFEFKNAEHIFIPDYAYEEQMYKTAAERILEGKILYGDEPEEIKEFIGKYGTSGFAICAGTMNPEKKLEEAVEVFSKNAYPLLIAGRFYDKERYKRLKEAAAENVCVCDVYLSRESYTALLSAAEYALLPYAPDQYSSQTSGVLQEAVFADTIALSYGAVLEGNYIPGLSFSSMNALTDERLKMKKEEAAAIHKEYGRLRKEVYAKDKIKEKLCAAFES